MSFPRFLAAFVTLVYCKTEEHVWVALHHQFYFCNEPSAAARCCSRCPVQPPSVPQTSSATLRVVATSRCVHMFMSHCSLPSHSRWDRTDPGNPGVQPTLGRVNRSGQEGHHTTSGRSALWRAQELWALAPVPNVFTASPDVLRVPVTLSCRMSHNYDYFSHSVFLKPSLCRWPFVF